MMFKSKQTGIGLLELMLSLVIIAVLLVMAVRYYGNVQADQRITTAVQMVKDIYQAQQDYIQSHSSVGNVNDLQDAGLLTSQYNSNPWRGTFDISQKGNYFTITIDQLPLKSCMKLRSRLETTIGKDESISRCPQKGGTRKVSRQGKLSVTYLLY